MRDLSVFERIVQPSVERIPLLDIQYQSVTDGRDCVVSHVISRNVFTDFDVKLSRHLAAVRGGGFPAVSSTIRIRDVDPMAEWVEGRSLHFASMPHALRGISQRALGKRERAKIMLASTETVASIADLAAPERVIERCEIAAFGAALEVCRSLGATDFLELSGDFDMLMVKPSGGELAPISIDLFRGMVNVPATLGKGGEGFVGPLYDLRRGQSDDPAVRGYMAAARHRVSIAKEDAVMEFRAAAEDRIHAFDRALSGRRLVGHRLDAVMALVARLRTGLGDELRGISEDARITALDWADVVSEQAAHGAGFHGAAAGGASARPARPNGYRPERIDGVEAH